MKRAALLVLIVAAAVAIAYPFRSSIRNAASALRQAAGVPSASSDGFGRNTSEAGNANDLAQPPRAVTAATPRADVSIDPRRQQLIGVRTVPARRASLAQTIRTTGNVRADETRQTDINLKVEGWIRELYVDYTGQAVQKGQPLFTLYSPDLFTSEQEYILALKSRDQMQSSQIAEARDRADQLVGRSLIAQVVDHDGVAFLCCEARGRSSDPAATAGDD